MSASHVILRMSKIAWNEVFCCNLHYVTKNKTAASMSFLHWGDSNYQKISEQANKSIKQTIKCKKCKSGPNSNFLVSKWP